MLVNHANRMVHNEHQTRYECLVKKKSDRELRYSQHAKNIPDPPQKHRQRLKYGQN